MAKVAVIGDGYAGLTTAACLTHLGHGVRCTDTDRGRVARLCEGKVPIAAEGSAVHDLLHPDRIVIGADDESTAIKISALFLHTSAPLVVTDPATAETIKYASKAFLATKVSFIDGSSPAARGAEAPAAVRPSPTLLAHATSLRAVNAAFWSHRP